jgi:hypothetical protein
LGHADKTTHESGFLEARMRRIRVLAAVATKIALSFAGEDLAPAAWPRNRS